MILYRHCDRRFPFLWESSAQPSARWHGDGDGPAQYFADTPAGAWAEFLRHEGIVDESDLDGVARAVWAVDVEIEALQLERPRLAQDVLLGGESSYPQCRRVAKDLRAKGAQGLRAPSAALLAGGAAGWIVDGGEKQATARDGEVFVLFGLQPRLTGWPIVENGRPPARYLRQVRRL